MGQQCHKPLLPLLEGFKAQILISGLEKQDNSPLQGKKGLYGEMDPLWKIQDVLQSEET